MEETLKKTIFGKKILKEVNIERPLRVSDRLHGHFVTGHIDYIGQVFKIKKEKNVFDLYIKFPKEFVDFIQPKGSITVDGISLTVVSVKQNIFMVSIIPHTLKITTLGEAKEKDCVNLEFDIISKQLAIFAKKYVKKTK